MSVEHDEQFGLPEADCVHCLGSGYRTCVIGCGLAPDEAHTIICECRYWCRVCLFVDKRIPPDGSLPNRIPNDSGVKLCRFHARAESTHPKLRSEPIP